MLLLMHLYAIASGYAPKPANSAPTPTGPADHLQPIACTTGPHRLQPLCSTSEAPPAHQLADATVQAARLGPDRCSAALRNAYTPASHAMQGPTVLYFEKKLQQENCYIYTSGT
jgi:hypothetical protein